MCVLLTCLSSQCHWLCNVSYNTQRPVIADLSILHEADLVPSILPPILARAIRHLSCWHKFARNDLEYHFVVDGFGPIPGTEAMCNALLFDVSNDATLPGAVLGVFSTPDTDASTHRGLELPPSMGHGYSRVRDLRVVALISPTGGPDGLTRVDFTVLGSVNMPIPRLLLPTPLIRWFISFVFRLAIPHLVRLNERFEQSPLQARVHADEDGFYSALKQRFPDKRHHASEYRAAPINPTRVGPMHSPAVERTAQPRLQHKQQVGNKMNEPTCHFSSSFLPLDSFVKGQMRILGAALYRCIRGRR